MTTQEQLAALMQQQMQQQSHTLATVHQVTQQMQQMHQAGVGSAPSSCLELAGFGNAKVLDLRHLKYTIFDGTPSKYDDWTFRFQRAIRSASCDAHKLLTHVEREPDDVRYGRMTWTRTSKVFRMESVFTEMYDLLCQVCTGDALSCVRAVDDARAHGLATAVQEVEPEDHGASNSSCRSSHSSPRRSRS